jgi:multidrug resistance efflux pump
MNTTSSSSEMAASVPPKKHRFTRQQLIAGLSVIGVLSVIGAAWYLIAQSKYVYTDKAYVDAPLIKLTPQAPGLLKYVHVDEGDTVYPYQPLARVGDEIISAQVSGTAVTVQKNLGAMFSPGQPVVTMIEPQELRIIARIEEDKGLSDVHPGQIVYFTLDAFGSKQFEGTVQSISQTSREGDVVFNISDKREVKEFNVKINYDHGLYPQFQNGMSARVWIVK